MLQEKGDATSILVVAIVGRAIRSVIAVASANLRAPSQKPPLAVHPCPAAIHATIVKVAVAEAVSFAAIAVNTVVVAEVAVLVVTARVVAEAAVVSFAGVSALLLETVKVSAVVVAIGANATAVLILVRFSISRFIQRTSVLQRWLKRFAILVALTSCSKSLG